MPSFDANLRARIVGRLVRAKNEIEESLCTAWVRAAAWCWGIGLGSGTTFRGLPILRRAAGSTLRVGAHCMFFSSRTANLVGINRPCYLTTLGPKAVITIGDGCGMSGTVISGALSITIGNNLLCGANTTITDTDWHHTDPRRRQDYTDVPAAAVVIEDNVWLGLGCTVLKGVRIGSNSVIAAGSVVTKDIPRDVIAGGVPARVLRPLPVFGVHDSQARAVLEAEAAGLMRAAQPETLVAIESRDAL